MAKITIDDILTQFASSQSINSRFQQIEDDLNDKVLYRNNPTGEPNYMVSDFDMANNDLLNGGDVYVTDLYIGGVNWSGLDPATILAAEAAAVESEASAAAALVSENNAAASEAAAGISADLSETQAQIAVAAVSTIPIGTLGFLPFTIASGASSPVNILEPAPGVYTLPFFNAAGVAKDIPIFGV